MHPSRPCQSPGGRRPRRSAGTGARRRAVALESCAAELEATLRERDETTLSLTEAARESGYSADHLGRLVRDGRIPNAGRPGAPRIARSHLPRKTQAPATPLLVEKHRRGEVSNAQIVQSIIEGGIEMMARTKRSPAQSYGAGEWGRNRVRVFPDPKTGLFQIEWRENGRRLTRSLKHRDWRRAKRQADEFAAGYLGPELHRKADAESEPLTLETAF